MLVADEYVRAEGRRVVAVGRVRYTIRRAAVQIDAAIEFKKDIFGGSVRPSDDRYRAGLDHRNGHPVGEVGRSRACGETTIGKSVRIVLPVTVRTVFARNKNRLHLLAILEKSHGLIPKIGNLRSAIAEYEIAARRDGDVTERTGIGVKAGHGRAVGAARVLVKPGVTGKTGGKAARLTLREVIIEHRHHGDFVGGRAGSGCAERVPVVATFEGHIVAVRPEPLLETTR